MQTKTKVLIAAGVVVAVMFMSVAGYAMVRVISEGVREISVNREAMEAFERAGIDDELSERFGDDEDAAFRAGRELGLDGLRRVEPELLAEQFRLEARLVNAVPEDSCVQIAMGTVTVTGDTPADIQAAIEDMSAKERTKYFDVAAALAKSALENEPVRKPLEKGAARRAQQTFQGVFSPAQEKELRLLGTGRAARLGDDRSCEIARMLYGRLLTLPDEQLQLVVTWLYGRTL